MQDNDELKHLQMALYLFGIAFVIGVPLMMMYVWPSGWSWSPSQPEYEQMIMGM